MNNYKIENQLVSLVNQRIALESTLSLIEQLRLAFHARLSLLRSLIEDETTGSEKKMLKTYADALFADYTNALFIIESFGMKVAQKGN
jgi:hypothetical protein